MGDGTQRVAAHCAPDRKSPVLETMFGYDDQYPEFLSLERRS
jgi:hypothetical protein